MHPQDRLFCEIAVQLKLLTREQVAQCGLSQERDPRGRSAAAIAVTLGFISQPNADAVMLQQQRVLDRRREARAASRAQLEAESRAAAGLRAPQVSGLEAHARAQHAEAPPGSESRAPRRQDPTPTTPWVHADGEARLRSERASPMIEELGEELYEDANAEIAADRLASRETLDERPPARASARSQARELQAGREPQPAAARDGPWEAAAHASRESRTPQPAAARDSREAVARDSREAVARDSREAVARDSREAVARDSREAVVGESQEAAARGSREAAARESREAMARELREAVARELREAAAREPREAVARESREAIARDSREAVARESREAMARELREAAARELRETAMRESREAAAAAWQPAPLPREAQANAAQSEQRRDPQPRESREALPPLAAAVKAPRDPAQLPAAFASNETLLANAATRVTMPIEKAAPPRSAAMVPPPSAAGQRPGGRTQMGPGPGELRSPPFSAAATSAPLSIPSTAPPPPMAASVQRTLLETSGREQRRREQAARASKAQPRPVPAGRDWRNPSRPPPPMAAFDAEPMPAPLFEASTGAAANPLAPSAGRQLKAPPLDAPRYIDRALELCQEFGGSDLHVHAGAAPCVRVDGKLWPLAAEQRLSQESAERIIGELLDDAKQLQLQVDGELRFVYELVGGLRARGHAYVSESGLNLVLRVLPREVLAPERLGLGPAMRVLRDTPYGLCVCSGPAGAGKTTSLFSLTKALIAERALHVVSIENPIELQHTGALGLIEQRELGRHVASYAEGIDTALRQSADVIVISDLLGEGALEACLRACRARCLVLAGMRASSATSALTRLIFTSANPELTRVELAHGLRLLLQQRLLPKARVAGRVAVVEQLVNTSQVAQLIRDDKLQQLPAVMSASKNVGMTLLDDALDELVRVGTITLECAQKSARRSERFKTA